MVASDWFNIRALTAPIAVLFGFGFGLFAGPTMSPVAECGWIVGAIGIAALTWWSTAQSAHDSRASREHDQAQRDTLNAIPGNVIKGIETLLKSQNTDQDKLKDLNKYAIAGKALGLVDEVTHYLEAHKLPIGRRRAAMPWLGPQRWEDSNQARFAKAYRELFGERVKELIGQFKEIGVKLPQNDEAYFAPGFYSWVPVAISQIKDAASRLIAELTANLSASVALVSTIKKPDERE